MALSVILIIEGYDYSKPIVSAAGVAIGIGSAVLFLVAEIVDPDWNHPGELLTQFLRDGEGDPSLSRLQFFAWTGVVIFAFSWVCFIRVFSGVPTFPSAIPANVLAVMGISTGAALASSQVESLAKDAPTTREESWGNWSSMLAELTKNKFSGNWEMRPSLGRYQMFAWTVISIGIYVGILLTTVHQVWVGGGAGSLNMPDLDPTLVVLMGLSQAGFVGSKAISLSSNTTTPTTTPPAGAGGGGGGGGGPASGGSQK